MAIHIAQRGKNAGRPVSCSAKVKCTLKDANGNTAPHFETKEEAEQFLAQEAEKDHGKFNTARKKPSKPKKPTFDDTMDVTLQEARDELVAAGIDSDVAVASFTKYASDRRYSMEAPDGKVVQVISGDEILDAKIDSYRAMIDRGDKRAELKYIDAVNEKMSRIAEENLVLHAVPLRHPSDSLKEDRQTKGNVARLQSGQNLPLEEKMRLLDRLENHESGELEAQNAYQVARTRRLASAAMDIFTRSARIEEISWKAQNKANRSVDIIADNKATKVLLAANLVIESGGKLSHEDKRNLDEVRKNVELRTQKEIRSYRENDRRMQSNRDTLEELNDKINKVISRRGVSDEVF